MGTARGRIELMVTAVVMLAPSVHGRIMERTARVQAPPLAMRTTSGTAVVRAPQLRIGIGGLTTREGQTGSHDALFTVTLDPPATFPVTAAFTTANGSATAGADFAPATGPLVFAPGETRKTIAVPITGDTTLEPDETFLVILASTDATVGAPVTCVIADDDGATARE